MLLSFPYTGRFFLPKITSLEVRVSLCRGSFPKIISLDLSERLEALQRANAELKKKLRDNTEAMEKRISSQEAEIVRLEQELEERRSELAYAKRSEKELRAKDVSVCVLASAPSAKFRSTSVTTKARSAR